MNGKIIQLEYISPRCECGRDLPKGRKKKCYYCLPPSGNHHKQTDATPVQPGQTAEYTLSDWAARADAYGMSYGVFHAHIENGWPQKAGVLATGQCPSGRRTVGNCHRASPFAMTP